MTIPITDEMVEKAADAIDHTEEHVSRYAMRAALAAVAPLIEAAVREECAKVAEAWGARSFEAGTRALEAGDIDDHQRHAADSSVAKYR